MIDSLLDVSKTADTRLGVLTRPLTQKEVDYLKSNGRQVRQSMIAVDALALIVNPQNRVQVLSKPEIAEILSGQLTEWNQVVPGNDHLGKIEVVFDHQGSSTVQYMRDSLLNGGQFGPNVYAQKTPADVFKAVRENKNAVGVIGVSWISSDLKTREMSREEFAASVQSNDSVSNSADMRFSEDVKVIKVRGNDEVTAYMPYQLYIFDGSYPLYRQIYMVCTATGGTISHGFYSFVTGFHGQKIMMTTGRAAQGGSAHAGQYQLTAAITTENKRITNRYIKTVINQVNETEVTFRDAPRRGIVGSRPGRLPGWR